MGKGKMYHTWRENRIGKDFEERRCVGLAVGPWCSWSIGCEEARAAKSI